MAPSKTGKSAKKEKIFHPDSRKAGQLNRVQIRKNKLADAAAKRNKKQLAQVDVYGFFYHAVPPEGCMSLEQLHSVIKDVWLPRHDVELTRERTLRRKGRPKSARESFLEDAKHQEEEEYRTGIEVPDLTHAPTVELFRNWDQKEVAYLNLFRFVRISSTDPTVIVVSRRGTHPSMREPVMDGPL
ncbi:hypothetical protein CONPUDRAFT_138424 [Coniophora puteana RWD-64-598 SS2]|uniref:Translation machinery-associated protein 16 n=1 Tax=Coniophora puteana (strain RWD-64-598) TaxID=741705 RepID=A0A5M3MJ46_CONPW|nr:uncharacterized protein CONPUDRAFT_138424 [Coniophora puteana RWD-64-598 SS2]EIW79279.1 hypothetical protein CONPUDRAFT_138424 [Coniophora puteana RWD-64-598 SS2]